MHDNEHTPDPDDILAEFYDAEEHQLTDEERSKLTPILDLLKNFHDRYEKIEVLGTGGEKRVSKVYDHRLGRCVAMARPVDASTPERQEQFLREARLAASLSQPNILPIHNMGIDPGGIPFFTMELLPGDSLGDILKQIKKGNRQYINKYPLDALLGIFRKVCDAIAYAHSCNVLHLDLKPSNIRVGEFGDVIVCDWGLARALDNGSLGIETDHDHIVVDDLNNATLTGVVKGTPGFMAPEQAEGKTNKTIQTDIYALGAILYMILTHRIPVSGKSTLEILHNTREGNIVPPHKAAGAHNIPKALTAVAMKALSLEPANRYSHVPKLIRDIVLYLKGYATTAENAGSIKRLMLLSQRNAAQTFLIMLFLIILSVLSMGGLMALNQERKTAVAAWEESEKNLRLFLEEQETSTQLKKANTEIIDYLLEVPDLYHAAPTLAILEEQMQNELSENIRAELIKTKGILHFALEEFNAAVESFEQVPGSNNVDIYLPICREYARKKTDDTQLLDEKSLFQLLRDPQNQIEKPVLQFCFVNHIRRQPNPSLQSYLPLASLMLEFNNGMHRANVEILKLSKKREGYYLDLSHSKVSRLRIFHNMKQQQNILAPFKLKCLDISHSSIIDIQELGGAFAKELNMTGLKLKSEWYVSRILQRMGVERVIIDTENYSDRTLAQLLKFCEISDPFIGKNKLQSRLLNLSAQP